MIGLSGALFVALQISAAPTLVIRAPGGTMRVPTVASANGPMLRAESLAPAIPIRVTHDSSSWYTLVMSSTS